MSSIAERYLLLGLRLGEHVDGLVSQADLELLYLTDDPAEAVDCVVRMIKDRRDEGST